MQNSAMPSLLQPLYQSAFGRMMLLAALMHLLVLAALFLWPKQAVEEIPVRSLNITLGVDMAQMSQSAAVAAAVPPPAPAKPKREPIQEVQPPKAPAKAKTNEVSYKKKPEAKPDPKPVAKSERRPPAQQASTASTPVKAPSQYVRTPPAAASGSQATEVLTPEQAIRRYEQTMSAWLQRHRVVPELARSLGQYGSPVLRVQIGRDGAVKYFAIERSSGYQLIDDAAMDMVRRANPFPPPPSSYPGGQVLEFLIPVTFDLK